MKTNKSYIYKSSVPLSFGEGLGVRNYILTFFMLLSGVAFGQSPDCHFNIYIRNVKSELYDYKFVVLNEIEKPTFQAIKEYIELYGWDSEPYSHNFYGQENFFYSKSEKGNELIRGAWLSNYSPKEIPLRVFVVRKRKKTDKLEIMYVDIANPRCYMEIEFSKFKKGKRKSETFIDVKKSPYSRIAIIK